ncbi:MAG: bifunctional diaminohydroxyphosphoribosylaminopyrimidine deaminase/5-amino-6-(5-phosphoribosylamino)uracil reductase RibD [Kiritimatiellaeota bacterium]|nr:bifunctional diaminohydroxyphosphoribosylaminopyrimidine deaminase/5-amino-6-(5-phosphoribosylamino)uracil reductase RibD [Kiritimatiellota bacterium]
MTDLRPNDERWMRRALALARRGEGLTRPNPPVGAVVVAGDRRVGEGFHRIAGGPHAEVIALLQAGKRARGATLYVTLEPCSTWGRTPPCTNAILTAGIRRVVVAARDPNPKHAGRGLRMLRQRGVQVDVGVCAAEGRDLIAPFHTLMLTGRPFVTLKLGMTLDGRIADRAGASRWITSPAARSAVQALRRRVDAILVGGATIRTDNPSLRPRPDAGRCPLRVVVTASGKLPPRCQVLRDAYADCTVVATTPAGARRLARAKTAAHIWTFPARGGEIALRALLQRRQASGGLAARAVGGRAADVRRAQIPRRRCAPRRGRRLEALRRAGLRAAKHGAHRPRSFDPDPAAPQASGTRGWKPRPRGVRPGAVPGSCLRPDTHRDRDYGGQDVGASP